MYNRPIIGPVKIEEIHSTGKGLGVWNNKNYYIPFAIPEEIIYTQTENRRLGYRTARITEIIEKSQHRRNPPCKYFGICGGCNFMHIDYQYQLLLKKQILHNALKKYNIPFTDYAVEPAIKNTNYRNKASYQIKYEAENVKIGFHPEWENKNVLDIENCFLLQNKINEISLLVREIIKNFYLNKKDVSIYSYTIRCNSKDDCQIIFELNENYSVESFSIISDFCNFSEKIGIYYYIRNKESISKNEYIHIHGKEKYLFENILGKELRISPSTFFQNNLEITENILSYISENVNFSQYKTVYDLYSGNGTVSLSLLQNHSCNLIAIEGNPCAVDDAIFNSKGNSDHKHINGDVLETFNYDFVNNHPKSDVIILDPPRSGTLIEIQKTIIYSKPEKIIYISCNPVSLAWNLQQLCEFYTITNLKAFDMFPQTHQIEAVAILTRKN